MKKTRQFFSVLLTLAMLLSLVPAAVSAAGTYPAASAVSVDGGKSFSTGRLYFKNGEANCSSDSTDYNAYYEPTTGTLTLKNYNGKGIAVGGALRADITGTAKYNEILTADTSAITGKTITVAISSSVESGTIVSPATATVGKADTPSAPTGLSGLIGQPLSTVTLPGGWAWVDDTTVMSAAGTQTFKANYTDTTSNYENATNVDVTVEVIDKTNVSASITFADSELTYNGAGQAYETASISGVTAGANPGWTYAYAPSGTASLDASGKPQNAGTYTVTATYEDDDNYGTKSAVLEIKKTVPTGTPKYTEITTAGKTLADTAITTTGADFSVPGAVIWVVDDGVTPLPDTTTVAANTYYKWLFTPTDTDNYETLTGTIRLYRRSSGGGGGQSTSRYTVSFESNGGSKVSNQTVTRNSVMKEPTVHFDFDGWYSDKELKTKYDFSAKVTKSFTLYAKWTEKDNGGTTPDGAWKNPFADIHKNDWFYDSVKYAYENGLMKGVSNTEFAPQNDITRAMFVTVLYRIENEPQTAAAAFIDIESGSYYEKAVAWASNNGIIFGISENQFAPNDNITREQMAAIIYRYATFKGYDITTSGSTAYTDNSDISDYAKDAVIWAAEKSVMTGNTDGSFAPKANTTRAQAAAVFMRILENLK